MHNCIYSGHCMQEMCDKSCPTLAETTYLLERNRISMSSEVFKTDPTVVEKYIKYLNDAEGKTKSLFAKNTVNASELLTYCSICQKWRGSRLHCTVYNLKFSQYVESIKKSWSMKSESDELEYMRIWSTNAKVLIISNLDYVNFKDFECQTLLSLLQSREKSEFTTILVSPITGSLVGNGQFFNRFINLLNDKEIRLNEGKEVDK